MRKSVLLIFILIMGASCATGPQKEKVPPKMVPDHTPYIAGLIEASPDTTHHYPEVLVGYFTDNFIDSEHSKDFEVLRSYPGLYSPALVGQFTETSIVFGLTWEPEPNATVSVRGPLGTPKERTVTFTHEGKGIYGDVNYALERVPTGRYELVVKLPDGRTYQSITYIPEATTLTLPDSIAFEVKLKHYGDGTPREENQQAVAMPVNVPANSYITVIQKNESIDREVLLLAPGEKFRFYDRGPYWRAGSYYYFGLSKNQRDPIYNPWVQNLNKPKSEVWMYSHCWVRYSFFSKGVGESYSPIATWFTAPNGWQENRFQPKADAVANNDTTYLFDVSNIYKLGNNGKVLPKDFSDAIGFFGGYFSLYKQYTMYPIRNFDLDSVLATNN